MSNVSAEPFFMVAPSAPSWLLQNQAAYHAFFAATIDSVPDLSSYQEFEAVDLLDQLRRVLDAQRLLLIGLAQHDLQPDRRRVLDLRYIVQPTPAYGVRPLTIALLGKGCGSTAAIAEQEARQLWQNTTRLFPRYLYRSGLVPVTDPQQLEAIRVPITAGQQVVAFRKRVEQTALLRLDGAHPVPFPLHGGLSTMRDLCKTLLQLDRPCVVSNALTPVVLLPEERSALNSIASQLRKLAEGRERSRRMGLSSSLSSGEKQAQLQSQVGQQEREAFLPDPQATINSEVYESYLRQLAHPLLWRCYIVGQGGVPTSVPGALTAEIVGYRDRNQATDTDTALYLPTETMLVGAERQQALENLAWLEFAPHNDEQAMLVQQGELSAAYQRLRRLPRLVDVQEASCVFRLPGLPYRDEIGVAVHSGAFVTLAQPELPPPVIILGHHDDHTPHRVALNDLPQHTLIAGTTGSGKTTTCLNLLAALLETERPVPFLVIEPVNAEHNDYRALLSLPRGTAIHLFTVGDEQTAPFRLNPFTIAPGITVGEHISLLLTCFKAALPMWEPLPRIFLKALNRTYYRAGWTVTQKARGIGDRAFPTVYDFYKELNHVVESEIEHGGEVRDNLRGASKLRIEALLEGSCGRILAARETISAQVWLEQPTILELRHIGDDEDKALMVAFITLALREHCEHARRRQGGLQHITLIEEAHRLLGQAPEGASPEVSNTKGQAASAFAQMLAETRKYGEGLIIAEQLPTRLVPDVLGNTGLKIMHRLTAKEDREVMGRAMRFNAFQEDHVAALGRGQAAVYAQGIEAPVLVHIDGARWDALRKTAPTDAQIHDRVQPLITSHAPIFRPFAGCDLCPRPCAFRDHGEALVADRSLGYEAQVTLAFEAANEDATATTIMQELVLISTQLASHAPGIRAAEDRSGVAYCAFLYLKARSLLFRGQDGIHWDVAFRRVQQEG